MKFPNLLAPAEALIASAAIPVVTALAVPEELTALINLAHPNTPEAIQILVRAAFIGVAARVLYMIQPRSSTPVSVVSQVPPAAAAPPYRPRPSVAASDPEQAAKATVFERVMGSTTNADAVQ